MFVASRDGVIESLRQILDAALTAPAESFSSHKMQFLLHQYLELLSDEEKKATAVEVIQRC